MPMWIGHRFVETDDTPPAMTVSAAPAGGANRSKVAMANAIALGLRVSHRPHPTLPRKRGRVGWGISAGAPALRPITRLPDAPPRQATSTTPLSRATEPPILYPSLTSTNPQQ